MMSNGVGTKNDNRTKGNHNQILNIRMARFKQKHNEIIHLMTSRWRRKLCLETVPMHPLKMISFRKLNLSIYGAAVGKTMSI